MTNLYKVTATGLNFRKHPNISATIIKTLRRDDIVEVLSSNQNTRWSEVRVPEFLGYELGYVASRYITELTEEAGDNDNLIITAQDIKELAPSANNAVVEAFSQYSYEILSKYDINQNDRRLCHFMAQMAHESAGFTRMSENLNYSIKGLLKTFPNYFANVQHARTYARQPEKIANRVYANRMGNGAEFTGDGWLFRARGIIGLTGYENYDKFGDIIEVYLLDNPDKAMIPEVALKIAAAYWDVKKLNRWADKNYLTTITRRIQGGTLGLNHRRRYLKKAREIW